MEAQVAARPQIAGDDALVFDFFSEFSRFECELKKNGFVKAGPHESAQADWDTFADEVSVKLHDSESQRFISARDYLLEAPPRKQIVVPQGRVAWSENRIRDRETESRYLLRLVRDVRNNLFHGGKYPDDGYVEEQSLRDAKLLKSCLAVFHECAPVLRRTSAFRGAQQ